MLNFLHIFQSLDVVVVAAAMTLLAQNPSKSAVHTNTRIYYALAFSRPHFLRSFSWIVCVCFNISFWADSSPFSISYYLHTNYFRVKINFDSFFNIIFFLWFWICLGDCCICCLALLLSATTTLPFRRKNAMSSLNEVEKCVSITA